MIQRGDGYSYFVAQSGKESEIRGHAMHGALALPGLKPEISRAY